MTPSTFPEWLRATRTAQRRERDGKPWSQDDFIEALEAETGYKLYRPNYSGYETGATDPEPETVAKLLAFWAARGIEAPAFPEPEPPMSDTDRMVAAMDRQTQAIRVALHDSASGVHTPEAESLAAAILALTSELRAAREERAAMAAQLEKVQAVLDVLAPRAMQDAATPDAHGQSAGSGR